MMNKSEDFLNRMQGLLDSAKKQGRVIVRVEDIENTFPELESEEERIHKLVTKIVDWYNVRHQYFTEIPKEKVMAWLEKQGEPQDKGEISDGYHTFNELYYYRMLYNAAFFNMLPKEWVHKSKKHNDGEECFGGGWFIVMANLPTGQISNHYEIKDWDLFQIPEKEIADKWDGHTPQEAANRLHKYLLEEQESCEQKKVSIWKHWGGHGIAGNGEGKTIYLIKIGNTYSLSSCLGVECDYIELSELDNLMLEKQGDTNETINRDEFAQDVLRGAAINLITWIDYNAAEGNMCLSNMECKDIEDALVSGDWDKIYAYVKKKLEKQGEQKPIIEMKSPEESLGTSSKEYNEIVNECLYGESNSPDKVEPKFKVGDWLVQNERRNIIKVVDATPLVYKVVDILGYHHTITDDSIENNYHLWTIQDAKDGDVLVCKGNIKNSNGIKYERICLFNSLDNAFFTLTKTSNYIEEYDVDVNIVHPDSTVPATKEQRDTLMKAMADAGWEFDFEKKELKKIEDEEHKKNINGEDDGIDSLRHAKNILEKTLDRSKEQFLSFQIQAYLNTASDELYAKGKSLYSEERLEEIHKCMLMWQTLHNAYFYQKPAWSKEDENIRQWIISDIEKLFVLNKKSSFIVNKEINWLKSLKDRVLLPNSSEGDQMKVFIGL